MEKYLTVKEVAELLSLSTATIYDLCAAELIPFIRVPSPSGDPNARRLIRFNLAEVKEAVDSWTVAPAGLVSPIGRAA
jgi:excisionase family DNA binding protein